MDVMKLSLLAAALTIIATASIAGDRTHCPGALEYADRKAELRTAILGARNASAGRLLSRELADLRSIAPDRRSQALLDEGRAALGTGALDTASARLEALVLYCPDFAEGFRARGHLHVLQGRVAAALADIDRALALAPDHAPAMAERAALLMRQGRFLEAQEALSSALALNPWLPQQSLAHTLPGLEV